MHGLVDAPRGASERHILVWALPVPLILLIGTYWLERRPEPSMQVNFLETSFNILVLVWLVPLGMRRWGIAIRDQELLERGFIVESSFVAGWVTMASILAATVTCYLRVMHAPGAVFGWDSMQMLQSPYLQQVLWVGVATMLLAMLAGWLARPHAASPHFVSD